MKFQLVMGVLVLSVLLSACAKKRPLPPRGKRIGTVSVGEDFRNYMVGREITPDHCMMLVEMTDSKDVVLEISAPGCPDNNSLAAAPIASLKLWSGWIQVGDEYSTLLMAGNSSISAENVPVGVITDINDQKDEDDLMRLDSLCVGNTFMRMDLSKNCHIEVNGDMTIAKIELNKGNTLQSILLARANGTDDAVDAVSKRVTKLDGKLDTIKTALEESIKDLSDKTEQGFKDVATKLTAIEKDFAEKLTALEKSVKEDAAKERTKLETKILGEVQTKLDDLAKTLRKENKDGEAAVVDSLTKDFGKKMDDLKTLIAKDMDKKLEDLKKKASDDDKSTVEALQKENATKIAAAVDAAKKELSKLLEDLTTKLNTKGMEVDKIKEDVAKKISDANKAQDEKIEAAKKAIDKSTEDLKKQLDDLKKKVDDGNQESAEEPSSSEE
ncbi:MAG: hypothetical protein H6617_00635 [Bdellovibrionaceae bacterium]|nr:hypothetical protein [Bdellovibrionales bacterium]MCB9253172.1 hypothetical protein [Pseudobdellovibrionaceae bacterium]